MQQKKDATVIYCDDFQKKNFLFVFVLAGCDTPYDVFYEIENRTDKVVFIDADFWNPKKGTHEKDISFTCAAGETVRIFSDGGVNLKDYVPADLFSFPDGIIPHHFDKCNVYIDGVLMSDSLRCRKNWDYVAKKLLGVYTLRITEESVAAFGYQNLSCMRSEQHLFMQ